MLIGIPLEHQKNDATKPKECAAEMSAYLEYDKNAFRDKTVLLPCDDPEWSNFTKFFAQNFFEKSMLRMK